MLLYVMNVWVVVWVKLRLFCLFWCSRFVLLSMVISVKYVVICVVFGLFGRLCWVWCSVGNLIVYMVGKLLVVL